MAKNDELRLPPQNEEAEKAVLGALLIDNEAIAKVSELDPSAFYKQAHSWIFQAALELSDDGNPVDALSLVEKLQTMSLLEKVGGAYYLTGLADSLPSAANVEHYAGIVLDNHRRREGIAIANSVVQSLYDKTEDVDAAFNTLQKVLIKEESGLFPIFKGLRDAMSLAKQVLDTGEVLGIPFGFESIDRMTGGASPGDYVIIGARPSMGKTSLAVSIGGNMAGDGNNVALFSMETKKKDVALRYIAQETVVDISAMRRGKLEERTYKAMRSAQIKLSELPIYIDDTGTQTLRSIRSRIESQQRDTGVDVVIIDYIQLMSGSKEIGSVAKMTEYSKGLKAIAMDLNVIMIVLSQLSRAPEQRSVPRPVSSDLRESGALEQDADLILMLYQPWKYDIMVEPSGQFAGRDNTNLAEVIVTKNRNGPTGTIEMNFFGKKMQFTERAGEGNYWPEGEF